MGTRENAKATKGMILVNLPELHRLTLVHGWTQGDLIDESGLGKPTVLRILRTGQARMSTLREIADALGVEPFDLIDPAEYEPGDGEADRSTALESSGEWLIGRPLSAVHTASNGLQHRVFRMQHRHQPTRLGRGKRYDLSPLPDDAADRMRAKLVRHTEVCDRVGRSDQFPICYATYPESGRWVWWVVDEWVDGVALEQSLTESTPTLARTADWAWQLGEALNRLHDTGVVRRELSPANVLVRNDQSLMLTDFELAKLVENGPTVSEEWPDDPYRAPEIGAGTPTTAADWYSWGRLIAHAVSGQLPDRGCETEAIAKLTPRAVTELVAKCVRPRPSERPSSWSEIRDVVESWRQSAVEAR